MRLFVVFLTFLGTLGVMVVQNIHKGSQTAAILNTPIITTSPFPSQLQLRKIHNTSISTSSTTPTPFITPIVTSTPIQSLPTITSTPTPTSSTIISITPNISIQATPTPISTATPTMISTSGHIFYTSSYWKSKYYYCDTDSEWHTLSAKYLKQFNSEQELLTAYPTHVLHQPCK